jgi:hypothetical protein
MYISQNFNGIKTIMMVVYSLLILGIAILKLAYECGWGGFVVSIYALKRILLFERTKG